VLRAGHYDWAVTVNGQIVAAGHFLTPCDRKLLC
jgi:hypothetical protein